MKLPLKTLIVEDVKDEAEVLIKRLKEHHSDIISIADLDVVYSFEDAKAILKKNSYRLSILDIELDDEQLIFQLFDEIDVSHLGIVVYLTGSSAYTNQDLSRINPHFFVAKPPNIKDLAIFREQFDDYIRQLKDVEGQPTHYYFNNEIVLCDDHIYYIAGSNRYSIIYYIKNNIPGKVLITKTLKALQTTLCADFYWRVEKSFIVNNNKVSKYKKTRRSGGDVIFYDSVNFNVPLQERVCYSQAYLDKYLKY